MKLIDLEMIHKAYPELLEETSYFDSPSDYTPLLSLFGKIIIQIDDDDYSGDSRVLYECSEKEIGYLNFGWGSCSGCDSLQACSDVNEIVTLANNLQSQVKWLAREEMLKFFLEHDWEGEYSYHEEKQKEFITKVIDFLQKEENETRNIS